MNKKITSTYYLKDKGQGYYCIFYSDGTEEREKVSKGELNGKVSNKK